MNSYRLSKVLPGSLMNAFGAGYSWHRCSGDKTSAIYPNLSLMGAHMLIHVFLHNMGATVQKRESSSHPVSQGIDFSINPTDSQIFFISSNGKLCLLHCSTSSMISQRDCRFPPWRLERSARTLSFAY